MPVAPVPAAFLKKGIGANSKKRHILGSNEPAIFEEPESMETRNSRYLVFINATSSIMPSPLQQGRRSKDDFKLQPQSVRWQSLLPSSSVLSTRIPKSTPAQRTRTVEPTSASPRFCLLIQGIRFLRCSATDLALGHAVIRSFCLQVVV